jgi:toxin ParE1/3/4
MARLVFTESADADSAAIFRYLTTNAGPRTVLKYRSLLNKLYDRLSDHPDSGAPRPALGQNIRIGIVSPYIVIYEHAPDAEFVTVLRIVHGRRRITAKLLAE